VVDGEFERLLGWIGAQGLRVLVAGLLIGLPVLALSVVAWAHRLPSLRNYWHVPIVTRTAVIAGILLGWSVLYADPYAPSFRMSAVFEVRGVWDVPWDFFLRYRADPALYDASYLLPVLRTPDIEPMLAATLLMVGALIGVSMLAALFILRRRDLLAALVGIPFLVLFSLSLTIYLTALLAYTFNTLNFWAAAVAFLILQYYRRAANHG
jgi:hypothetical protein